MIYQNIADIKIQKNIYTIKLKTENIKLNIPINSVFLNLDKKHKINEIKDKNRNGKSNKNVIQKLPV